MKSLFIPDLMTPLDENQRTLFMAQYDAQKKSVGVAYLLLIFLGLFGVHKFYLDRSGWGVIYIITTLFTVTVLTFIFLFFDLLITTGDVNGRAELLEFYLVRF